MNDTYYVKTEEKEHTVKIQNEEEKFYSYDGELVEDPTGTLVEKTITENGEYLPASDNADGYSKVTVDVPVPVNKLPQVVDGTIKEILAEDLLGCTKIKNRSFYYSTLEKIVIPDTVTSIETEAFNICNYLTDVTIGSNVVTIASYAFGRCGKLRDIKIPDNVETIGSSCFYQAGLRTIRIGSGIKNIGAAAFDMCVNMQQATILAIVPPTLSHVSAFYDTNNCPIYVPAESVEVYKTATNWSSLASRIFAIQE